MKAKKILAMALLTAVMVSSLAGCGGGNSNASSTPGSSTGASAGDGSAAGDVKEVTFPLTDPVTMSMFAITNNDVELPDAVAFQEMEKMTNVKWEVQSVMGADLAEKRNLLLASNQYPDVFFKAGLAATDLEKYGSQGVFVPLDELITQYAPNLSKLLDERAGVRELITLSDGHIYSLPEVGRPLPAGNVIYFINQNWMQKLGLQEPTSLDELYNVLKAFKEKDPNGNGLADEIPFTANTGLTPLYLLPYFGVSINYDTKTAIVDGKLSYVPTMDTYKEFLQYITTLYSEGLMDKNGFTNTDAQQVALGAQGDILGSFFNGGAFQTVGRDRDTDYKELTPFVKGVYPVTTGSIPGTLAITDACKTPEVAMAWADQWYSQEGGNLAWMGIEGQTYKVNEDGTWEWLMEGYDDLTDLREHAGVQGAANHPSVQPELWFDGMTDKNEKYLDEQRARLVAVGASPFPTLSYSDADSKTLSSIKADIDPYIIQYMAQVATGELQLDASWEEYVATLNNMGLTQMMDIYQKAFEATQK